MVGDHMRIPGAVVFFFLCGNVNHREERRLIQTADAKMLGADVVLI